MQSAEDRSEYRRVRGRIDRRYAPGLERDDPGFNSSSGPPNTPSFHLFLDRGFKHEFNTCE